MSTIRRLSRHRRETPGDPIQVAWDRGDLPPPEAFEPANFDALSGCIFFRWCEHSPAWTGDHHPHVDAWHNALLASRAAHMRRSRRRGGALLMVAVAEVEKEPDAAA